MAENTRAKTYIGVTNALTDCNHPTNMLTPFSIAVRLHDMGVNDMIFDDPIPTERYTSEQLKRIRIPDGKIVGVYVEMSEYEKIKGRKELFSEFPALPKL